MFTRRWFADVAERAAATWAEVFLALLIVGWTDHVDLSTIESAAFAAVPAALAVIKGAVASLRGNPETASLTADG